MSGTTFLYATNVPNHAPLCIEPLSHLDSVHSVHRCSRSAPTEPECGLFNAACGKCFSQTQWQFTSHSKIVNNRPYAVFVPSLPAASDTATVTVSRATTIPSEVPGPTSIQGDASILIAANASTAARP